MSSWAPADIATRRPVRQRVAMTLSELSTRPVDEGELTARRDRRAPHPA